MASNADVPEAAGPSDSAPPSGASPAIILHILSPSVEAPNRLTLNDLPLTTKVGELKDHIYRVVASQPRPETQRLIYRGKPLLNDAETLRNIVDPSDVSAACLFLMILRLRY